MNIYSIYDNKGKTWHLPFFQKTDVHATRVFTNMVNDPDAGNIIYSHPDDYDLYKVGEWDEDDGKVAESEQTLLKNGAAVKK